MDPWQGFVPPPDPAASGLARKTYDACRSDYYNFFAAPADYAYDDSDKLPSSSGPPKKVLFYVHVS